MKSCTRSLLLAAVPALVCACASESPKATSVRFANQPVVTRVADRENVAKLPVVRAFYDVFYQLEGSFYQRVVRAFDIPRPQRALGVNAIDEVPNSTWFTNRNTVRKLTPEELVVGPARSGNPEDFTPWTIISTKTGGVSPGFLVRDTRGMKYIVKFDKKGEGEAESATSVIVNRLLWAAGLNVPEDYVVEINMRDLIVARDSKVRDAIGEQPMQRRDFEAVAAQLEVAPDGHMRGLASKLVEGRPLGGHPGSGVRTDDPNDVIPHELRRDLRGLYALFAWLDHTDLKESNTLDVYARDPQDPSRHYVVHYHIDFGRALGTMASSTRDPRRGYQYAFDPQASVSALLSAGTVQRPWEGRVRTPLPGLGLYEAYAFDPGSWHPYTASYVPMLTADRIDNYWGTKLVMSFTPDQLRAAISAGRLSDPVAAEYLLQQMIARQRMTGAYWFARVNPLDRFTVRSYGNAVGLCFEDLMLTNHLVESAANTRYAMVTANRADSEISTPFSIRARSDGRSCTGPLTTANDGDGYTIVKLTTRGRGEPLSTHVHLARDPADGQYRVIGVYRR